MKVKYQEYLDIRLNLSINHMQKCSIWPIKIDKGRLSIQLTDQNF